MATRVSNVYLDDRYNRTRLYRTYKLPEVGGDFGKLHDPAVTRPILIVVAASDTERCR